MRIAYVSTMAAVPWGGSEELWAQSAKIALKEGHEVLTLTFGHETKPKKLESLIEAGASAFFWNHLHRMQQLNLQDGVPEYFPYHSLLEWRPDIIVVSHGGLLDVVNGHYLLIDLLLRTNIPFVIVIQANTELYKPSDQQRPIMKAYFSHAKKVFFVSKGNLNLAERQLASKLENADVIKNPLNLVDHDIVPFPDFDPDKFVNFACVGRLDIYSKGQDVLFEVLGSEKWLDRKWILNMYGVGDDNQYLSELALFYGISDRVIFHGQVESVRKIWEHNHLLLLPSRIEGTPLVLYEAMLCGRSAVVTNIGGNAEWIKDKENGFVASAPFPGPLSDAMECAWNERYTWKHLGELARAYLLENHEIQSGSTLLKAVFDSVTPVPEELDSSHQGRIKVSVVIVCHDSSPHLRECVSSIISQQYKNFEIVVVDTSYAHEVTETLTYFANQYPQYEMSLLKSKNSEKLASARNDGVRVAKGEYVLCLDPDDFISPKMLAMMVEMLDKNAKHDIVYSNYQTFESSSTFIKTGPFELGALAMQNRLPSSVLFRKSLWNSVGGYRTNCSGYEDWDFWITLAEKGHVGLHIDEVLLYCRMRDGGVAKQAEKMHDQLLANIILNHPHLYTEETKSQAREYLHSLHESHS